MERTLLGPGDPIVRSTVEHLRRDVNGGADRATVSQRAADYLIGNAPLLGSRTSAVISAASAEICGLGVLEPLLAEPGVDEIMINGPDQLWVERHGRFENVAVELSAADIRALIERVLAPLSLRVDRLHPVVDARLPDGSRVHAVIPPLAVDGPYLTIRRFRDRRFRLTDFADPTTSAFLGDAARDRRSLLVCGATGSGKTSLLAALGAAVADDERLITIEDTAELRLPGRHVVRLEARPPTAEGLGGITIRDLVRTSLRMRPDRIIVGEVRGGEALDMVQAMTTGHRGSMSTVHADSCGEALRRLEVMMLMSGVALPVDAVRRLIAMAIDLVVMVARGTNGTRRVVETCHVRSDTDGLRAEPVT